jgi:hypothetical protein
MVVFLLLQVKNKPHDGVSKVRLFLNSVWSRTEIYYNILVKNFWVYKYI